jgi:hypothetical protein
MLVRTNKQIMHVPVKRMYVRMRPFLQSYDQFGCISKFV